MILCANNKKKKMYSGAAPRVRRVDIHSVHECLTELLSDFRESFLNVSCKTSKYHQQKKK